MSVTVNGKKYEAKMTKEGLTLDLHGKKINDISQIEGLPALTNLQSLDLNSNQIREIKGLDTLANLQWLNLYRNQISEIKGLDALVKLQKLDLSWNKITEIKGLDALANLQWLNLNVNQISEIKGLDALANLRELNLQATKISEVKGLENLTQLTYLSFCKSPVNKWATSQWGENNEWDVKRVPEAVAYCQRQVAPLREAQRRKAEEQQAKIAAEQSHTAVVASAGDKLKKLIKVSRSLKIAQIGEYLGLSGQELMEKLVDWAAEYGFVLDNDIIDFTGGRKDDFLATLDKEFASWGKQTGGKV